MPNISAIALTLASVKPCASKPMTSQQRPIRRHNSTPSPSLASSSTIQSHSGIGSPSPKLKPVVSASAAPNPLCVKPRNTATVAARLPIPPPPRAIERSSPINPPPDVLAGVMSQDFVASWNFAPIKTGLTPRCDSRPPQLSRCYGIQPFRGTMVAGMKTTNGPSASISMEAPRINFWTPKEA